MVFGRKNQQSVGNLKVTKKKVKQSYTAVTQRKKDWSIQWVP